MKDLWYGDNRDLVKWAILYHLADLFKVKRIFQVAFYNPNKFAQVKIDGQLKDVPKEVISHFRDVRNASKMNFKIPVEIFYESFENNKSKRQEYSQKIKDYLSRDRDYSLIAFLDPDTGLQPGNAKCGSTHVSEEEAKEIFEELNAGDVFVFYQHQTNRRGEEWIEPKRRQLAKAIGLHRDKVKIAQAPDIAKDVVFFYLQKTT